MRQRERVWAERDWFAIRADNGTGSAELLIYDRIGEGLFTEGVTAKDMVAQLAAITADEVTVRINSPGGSVFDGLAIYNALAAHPAKITTQVDGLAASIASIIALAGAERRMAGNALLMIHSPWSMVLGTAEEMRAEADILDKVGDAMVAIYTEHSDLTAEQVRAALAEETWYTAAEAEQAGFATAVGAPSAAAAHYLPDLGTFARTTPPAAPAAPEKEKEAIVADTQPSAAPTVDLTPLAERIDQLEARIVEHTRPTAPPQPVSVVDVFASLVREYGQDRSKVGRNAADMVTGGNPGLTSTERTSKEIIEYFDDTRYFVSRVAGIPFPESGIVHTLPRKTQRSQVGQAAEKAAPPSRAITTDTVQFTGVWYKGYLDISYELIRTSSPGAVAVAVDDMLGEAAVESELEFIAAVETAATALAPLDFTDYGAFVKSVRAAVRAIRAAAGKGTPKFALTSDNWDEILAFTDTTDRRLLSTRGSMNADGSVSLVSEELDLAGITFFESPHSNVDVAFNDNALKRSELPPLQLSADNVPLVGRDVAVLGNIMAVTRIPAGIIALTT